MKELDRISQTRAAWNIFSTESYIISVATTIRVPGLAHKYAVALVFTKEIYYLLDRPKMEETVRQVAELIEETISSK